MQEKESYKKLEERIRELESQLKSNKNREYKSRLFSFLFGKEENKKWTMSLYNAIHGTSHNDISNITINTIDDVVYMGMKNDLSILVSEIISMYKSMELYEQQSSYNPNMPIREFMYAGKLYDKFIYLAKLNRYSKKLLPLPLPKLVVFYNGEDEKDDEIILSLSDAFREEIRQNLIRTYSENESKEKFNDMAISAEVDRIFQEASPDIEVKVQMININYGHNKEILAACRPLKEYAWFVAKVRKNHAESKNNNEKEQMNINDAIDSAINEMPENFEIKKFIMANRAEVKDMCLTEYNEAETMEMIQEEARREGRQEGQREGQQTATILNIKNLMESTGWTAEKAMDLLKIPQNQRVTLYINLSKDV